MGLEIRDKDGKILTGPRAGQIDLTEGTAPAPVYIEVSQEEWDDMHNPNKPHGLSIAPGNVHIVLKGTLPEGVTPEDAPKQDDVQVAGLGPTPPAAILPAARLAFSYAAGLFTPSPETPAPFVEPAAFAPPREKDGNIAAGDQEQAMAEIEDYLKSIGEDPAADTAAPAPADQPAKDTTATDNNNNGETFPAPTKETAGSAMIVFAGLENNYEEDDSVGSGWADAGKVPAGRLEAALLRKPEFLEMLRSHYNDQGLDGDAFVEKLKKQTAEMTPEPDDLDKQYDAAADRVLTVLRDPDAKVEDLEAISKNPEAYLQEDAGPVPDDVFDPSKGLATKTYNELRERAEKVNFDPADPASIQYAYYLTDPDNLQHIKDEGIVDRSIVSADAAAAWAIRDAQEQQADKTYRADANDVSKDVTRGNDAAVEEKTQPPTPKIDVVAEAPDPSEAAPPAAEAPKPAPEPAPAPAKDYTDYTVAKGDSLWKIAKDHYGLTKAADIQKAVETIARANGLQEGANANHIDIGDELKLPDNPASEGKPLDWAALDRDAGISISPKFDVAATGIKHADNIDAAPEKSIRPALHPDALTPAA